MGQRLNIEIKKQEKLLANAYYHWSAYSEASLLLTKEIIDKFEEVKEETDVTQAIMLLQITGAGLTSSSMEYLEEIIPNFEEQKEKYQSAIDRNEGLIEITEKGMENTQYWEEGRITIHIDTKTFDFEVFDYPDLEEFEECYEIKIEDLPTLEFPIKNIKFEQIDKVLELVKKTQETSNGAFKDVNGTVYGLIW